MEETRFTIEVRLADRPFRVPKEVSEEIKGVLSRKMLSRMKKEYVECPIAKDRVPFLICFVCPSFIRRVKGVVHCKGEEGPSLK